MRLNALPKVTPTATGTSVSLTPEPFPRVTEAKRETRQEKALSREGLIHLQVKVNSVADSVKCQQTAEMRVKNTF